MKNKIIALFLFFIVIGFVFLYGFSKHEEVVEADTGQVDIINSNDNNSNSNDISNDKKIDGVNYVELISIDIKGAVAKPGVYEIESNKRVVDVIELAGGLTSDANTNYINLSTKLKDEMVIWVYTNEEISELELEKSSVQYMIKECNCPTISNSTCINNNDASNEKNDDANNKDNIININTASLEELMSLSGVGESKAKAIIEYREKNGEFKNIEDLKNVSGIGEALFHKIKPNIKV